MRAAGSAQLELAFPDRPVARGDEPRLDFHRQRISGLLSILLPEPVDIVFNDNRSTMVSFKRRLGRLEIRLHRMFRHADDRVLGTLARFVAGRDSRASRELDRFIERHRAEIRARKRRAPRPGRTAGRFQDLGEILDGVCREYFGGAIDVRVCWGRASRRGKRPRRGSTRTRALATYSFDDSTIRLSPVLDSPEVPRYVLEWIVYHELLHHVLPVERASGRSRYHTSRFKALERAFARYEDAKRWEEDNLEWLLR